MNRAAAPSASACPCEGRRPEPAPTRRLRGLLAHEGAGADRAQHVILVAGHRGHGVGADRRVRLGRQIDGPLLGGLIPDEAVARGGPAGRIDQRLELAATDAGGVADGDGRGGDVVRAEGEVVLVEERQPQRDDALVPLAQTERCIERCGEAIAGGRERGVRNSRRVSEPRIGTVSPGNSKTPPETVTSLVSNAARFSSVRGKSRLVNGPPGCAVTFCKTRLNVEMLKSLKLPVVEDEALYRSR